MRWKRKADEKATIPLIVKFNNFLWVLASGFVEALKGADTVEKKEKNPFVDLSTASRKAPRPEMEKMVRKHALITTIIVDVGEVQITGWDVGKRLEPILKTSDTQILKKLAGDDLRAFFIGSMTEEEFWKRVITRNEWPIDVATLKKAVRESFREVEGTREILEKLRLHGFKLGLISNHGKEWVEYISKKFDYHMLFHSTLYSFEVAMSKSDKRMYKILLEKLGSKPEECLFIDDQEKNIAIAKELGMKTILFKDAERLRHDLISLGINLN